MPEPSPIKRQWLVKLTHPPEYRETHLDFKLRPRLYQRVRLNERNQLSCDCTAYLSSEEINYECGHVSLIKGVLAGERINPHHPRAYLERFEQQQETLTRIEELRRREQRAGQERRERLFRLYGGARSGRSFRVPMQLTPFVDELTGEYNRLPNESRPMQFSEESKKPRAKKLDKPKQKRIIRIRNEDETT